MKYTITPMASADRDAVMDIYNHYIEHSFAAYRQNPLPRQAFDLILESSRGYPSGILRNEAGIILGFGLLRAHKAIPEFAHTAEIMYFLHPDYLRLGLGRALLNKLEEEGREQGITTILAHISSKNPSSIAFHAQNGFLQCGCFKGIGKKNGQDFDVIWMQKVL